MQDDLLRTASVTRYVTPLREGGSLPALAEADDGFKYVVKFRGAGHGTKALIAELIGGEVARAAGLRVPELVFLDIDEDFGRSEGDEEIQDLLKASRGLNIGLHYLSGAFTWDGVADKVSSDEASKIVWIDGLLTNVDRTVRNTNMLKWHNELWLIDHGASLYFHHSWPDHEKARSSRFPYLANHALLSSADKLVDVDTQLRLRLNPQIIERIVDAVPSDWLEAAQNGVSADEQRKVYKDFLNYRVANSNLFIDTANDARSKQ